jgi:hypothetical protein
MAKPKAATAQEVGNAAEMVGGGEDVGVPPPSRWVHQAGGISVRPAGMQSPFTDLHRWNAGRMIPTAAGASGPSRRGSSFSRMMKFNLMLAHNTASMPPST